MPTISFSGLASGIDGDSIIQALSDSRRVASLPLENKIADNKAESNALEELNTRLLNLKDSLGDFLTLSGGALSKNVSSSFQEAVSATASSSVVASSVTVDVEQLAKSATVSFLDRFSEADKPLLPDLATPSTIEFTIGEGDATEVITVEVDNKTALADIVSDISELSGGKVQASIVNAGTTTNPEYLLLINGSETGLEKGKLEVSVGAEITNAGLFSNQQLEQAQDAILNVSGIGQVSRATNTVADLIPGLTLELKQAGVGPVTLTVDNDTSKTAEKLRKVIEAVNAVITHSSENSLIERVETEAGSTNKYGSLARTRLDEQIVGSIRSVLTSSVSTIEGSEVTIFANLGVTTARDGTLEFDETVFNEALAKDPTSVGQILNSFGDGLATANGVIEGYTKFQGQIDSSITSNTSQNDSTQNRLDRIEQLIADQEANLRKVFASLEVTISRLNSQSESLLSLLQIPSK